MTLERFFKRPREKKPEKEIEKPALQETKPKTKKDEKIKDDEPKIEKYPREDEEIIEGIALDVGYDGQQAKAYIWIYDLKTQNLIKWLDTSGHLPYLLSNLSIEEIKKHHPNVERHRGFAELKSIKKFDLIRDRPITMTKVIAKDPLSIGGRANSIRNMLGTNSWEDYIRYHKCYAYDKQIVLGMPYQIQGDKLNPIHPEIPKAIKTQINHQFESDKEDYLLALDQYLEYFFSPIPNIRRVAFDIEVYSEGSRIPDAGKAEDKIICISFAGTDGLKRILTVKRDDVEKGETIPECGSEVEIFNTEREVIRETFKILEQYPIVLSYNGDNFDLKYIYNRAINLGLRKDDVPFYMTVTPQSEVAHLKNGIHVDLYKFFHNRAIKVSAFKNIYSDVTLNTVGKTFLNEGKIGLDKAISELNLNELGYYCLRDSEITLALTTFNNNLILNLIFLLMRITRLSMEDLTRQGVSTWLRNLFYAEHRARAFIIPKADYIQKRKGKASTKAMIKGKKYKGAIVVKPIPGVHFNVVVLDFASLYPSIIKTRNLSYETVNCPHPECRSNKIPETPHWVCTRKVGIMSLIIGLLRDLRVKYFKNMAKDESLSKDEQNMYKIITQSLKIIINASYGVFGSEAFPLFCLPVAEATTAIGRYAITQTQKECERIGMEVIYGDSIIGSRCVVVKKDGMIDVTPIADIWNECEKESNFILGKEVKIPDSLYTLSKDGKWKKVKQIIRHLTKKRLFRINQKNGETICTEDHSLLTKDYEKITPENLGNNKILFLNRIPVEPVESPEVIDLFPLVKNFKLKTTYKGKEKISEWKTDGEAIWFGWTTRKNQLKIKRYCKLSDLCKLLGIYIADGHSSFHFGKYGYKAACGISSGDISFLNELKELMKSIDINHTISIIRTTKEIRTVDKYSYEDTTHRIQTNSTTWTAFFASLCGVGSANKHLPTFIYNIERKYQELLFEYYLIGDGSIDKGNIRTFTTKSLHLVSGLCYLLKSWNIDTSIYYYNKRDVYRVRERQRAVDSMHPIETKIWELPIEERYVYDLSVEETEMFVDACGMLLLHNTDSVFLKNPTDKQIQKIIDWSDETLQIELDVEKVYRYLALSDRKKNYLGVYKDGSVDIKGLTGKKRHVPPFIQNAFREMVEELRKVQAEEDFEEAKQRIRAKLKSFIKKLEKKEFSVEELAFRMTLSKDLDKYTKTIPQHVRAARLLVDQLHEKIKSGDIIQFVKTKSGVLPVKLAKKTDISVKKYKQQLESTFEQVLDAMGIPFDELYGMKVRKLDAFV
ncbi:MAG: DNA-directed DNA polymerase I [Candidatus Helarchaeota archaeon]|nr:DNA-directed DNA polymerase I [Candidatus Helarchaeota archaeon]